MKFASLCRPFAAAALLAAVVGCAESTAPVADPAAPAVEEPTTPPADPAVEADPAATTETAPAVTE